MDPLTQGVVATVAGQQAAKPRYLLIATVLSFLSGMAPDLDVLLRSSTDPLLALEYHRHFTHSLLFIPIGGLLCASFFYVLFARRCGLSFKQTYIFCTLGYATHGLLDAYTSYGTQLLWPFSDARIAWDMISIIDPLFTIPLLLLVVTAAIKRQRDYPLAALSWLVIYSSAGIVQRERAENFAHQLIETRGHQAQQVSAKPSFANLLVWKIVYDAGDYFYVDAVRMGFSPTHYPGSRIAKLDIDNDFPWLDVHSQQAKDIERFRWFSNGYIALSPDDPNRVMDIRYSLLPHEIQGLWGVQIDPSADEDTHIRYVTNRQRSGSAFDSLWQMIRGDYTQ